MQHPPNSIVITHNYKTLNCRKLIFTNYIKGIKINKQNIKNSTYKHNKDNYGDYYSKVMYKCIKEKYYAEPVSW